MGSPYQLITEPWSRSYDLIPNAEIHTYGDDEAVMDFEMYEALEQQFGNPVVGYVGGLHYHFIPERTVPQGSVAVPEHRHDDPSAFLIQR